MAKTDVTASLGLDSSRFKSGLANARGQLNRFASFATGKFAGVLAAVGFTKLANDAVQLASRISDVATQLNSTTDEVQALQFAAQEAGVGNAVLERGMRNLILRTQEAEDGNRRYGDAFRRLRIDLESFLKLSPARRLEVIARAQANAADQSQAFLDVSILIGQKAGPELTEVLKRLATEGYQGIEDAARDAGQVMDAETIAKLDVAADAIESAKKQITILTAEILVKLVPGVRILGRIFQALGLSVVQPFVQIKRLFDLLMNSARVIVKPVVTSLGNLANAFDVVNLAAQGRFSEAKRALVEVKDTAIEAVNELINVPRGVGEAFVDGVKEMGFAQSGFRQVMREIGDDIRTDWSAMWRDLNKESKEREREIIAAAQGGGPGMSVGAATSGTTSAGGGMANGGVGADADGGPQKGGLLPSGVRFERRAGRDGQAFFQRFTEGRKSGVFSPEQMQEALLRAGATGKDFQGTEQNPQVDILKSIEQIIVKLDRGLEK